MISCDGRRRRESGALKMAIAGLAFFYSRARSPPFSVITSASSRAAMPLVGSRADRILSQAENSLVTPKKTHNSSGAIAWSLKKMADKSGKRFESEGGIILLSLLIYASGRIKRKDREKKEKNMHMT